MKICIHDLPEEAYASLSRNDADTNIISDNGKIRPCIGCFSCWIKNPGICVLNDGYQKTGQLFSKCDELTIISKCVYGSYSPFVRNENS
jgi:multimeric flavodoxin WrbA